MEEGTDHLEGYVEFLKPLSGRRRKKRLGEEADLLKRRGTREEAREDFEKKNTRVEGPWGWGNWGREKGKDSGELEGCVRGV